MKDDIKELMNKKEDLLPELKACICTGSFGQMIKHPLVIEIMYNEQMNVLLNAQYRAKRARVDEAVQEKNWDLILGLHERPYRIEALFQYEQLMTDEEYWQRVAWVWSDSENLWQHVDELEELFWPANHGLETRHLMMTDREQTVWKDLTTVVTVYRGCSPVNEAGWSWTLDRKIAEWFVQRYNKPDSRVLTGQVEFADVIAYFNGRNEQEIVASPDTVEIVGS